MPGMGARGGWLAVALAALMALGACQPKTAPTVSGAAARQSASLPPSEPAVDDDPAQIEAVDQSTVEAVLGRPLRVRKEAPAEVWQYRSSACVMDLYLYPEAGGGAMVRHAEARDLEAAPVPLRQCLRSLLIEQREKNAATS